MTKRRTRSEPKLTDAREQAFPGFFGQPRGLSKREEFAKAAMQGLLANPNLSESVGASASMGDSEFCDLIAKHSVRSADELIRALNGGASESEPEEPAGEEQGS